MVSASLLARLVRPTPSACSVKRPFSGGSATAQCPYGCGGLYHNNCIRPHIECIHPDESVPDGFKTMGRMAKTKAMFGSPNVRAVKKTRCFFKQRSENVQTMTAARRSCAQCNGPVKRHLVVNWFTRHVARAIDLCTDCLEAHYVRHHGEPFDHARASSHVQRPATATEEVQTMTIEEELQTIEEHVHTMDALAHRFLERMGRTSMVNKEVQRMTTEQTRWR